MAVIECKGCKIQFIFLFLFVVIEIMYYVKPVEKLIDSKEGNYYSIESLAYLLTGIVYFLAQIQNSKNNIQNFNYKFKEQNTRRKVLLFIPGILYTLCSVIYCINLDLRDRENPLLVRDIELFTKILAPLVAFLLVDILIYKKKIYIHHKLSFSFVLLSTIINFACHFFFIQSPKFKKKEFKWKYVDLFVLGFIEYFLRTVILQIQKHLIDFYFYKPFFVQFMAGVSYAATYFPFFFLSRNSELFRKNLEISLKFGGMFVLFIMLFTQSILIMLIINSLPLMYVIIIIIFSVVSELYDISHEVYLIIWVIYACFVGLNLFVYTEAIQVNIFNLSWNTEENIKKRGENEFQDSLKNPKFHKLVDDLNETVASNMRFE